MKTIVIYKSATGFTKKYAEWIAEELEADLFTSKEAHVDLLLGYDRIIYGGRLYAVGIDGLKLITNNFDKLKEKKLVVFATGASKPSEEVMDSIRDHNLTPEQLEHVDFFYLRGGYDHKALPTFDRILMTLLMKRIENKQKKGKELNLDEIGMLEVYKNPADFTQKEALKELLESVREQ